MHWCNAKYTDLWCFVASQPIIKFTHFHGQFLFKKLPLADKKYFVESWWGVGLINFMLLAYIGQIAMEVHYMKKWYFFATLTDYCKQVWLKNLHFCVDYPVTLQNGTFEQLATKSTTLLKPDFLCFLSSKYLFMPQ